jgi:hypothetical protein
MVRMAALPRTSEIGEKSEPTTFIASSTVERSQVFPRKHVAHNFVSRHANKAT